MNDLAEKLSILRAQVASKGRLALLAAFPQGSISGAWDLVVSAPWITARKKQALDVLIAELRKIFVTDLLPFSKVVTPEPAEDFVLSIAREWRPSIATNTVRDGPLVAVSETGVVVEARDYYAELLRPAFPIGAELQSSSKEGDLLVRVSWKLGTDPGRPNKSSKIIQIKISEEALHDYLYSTDFSRAEKLLYQFVSTNARSFNPEHDSPYLSTPPVEVWKVKTKLFQAAG
jgi:hypothetical protein